MGELIDEGKLRKIFEDIMGVFKKHNLNRKEVFHVSQEFYIEIRDAFKKEKQMEFANSMTGNLLKKFGLGGGRDG